MRLVLLPDGGLGVGKALPGRGAWLCAGSRRCFEVAERRRAFDRAFRAPVPPAALDVLRSALFGPPGDGGAR